MAPETKNTVVCGKCTVTITHREYLTCSSCNTIFDLNCANVSEKRFYLMTLENKQTWKCIKCIRPGPSVEKSLYTPVRNIQIDNNITFRNKNINRRLSESLNSSLSSEQSDSQLSLPDMRTQDSDGIEELTNEITELRNQLISAHTQIDELSLEVNSCQREMKKKDLKIKKLLAIVTTTGSKINDSLRKPSSCKKTLIFTKIPSCPQETIYKDSQTCKDIIISSENNANTPLRKPSSTNSDLEKIATPVPTYPETKGSPSKDPPKVSTEIPAEGALFSEMND